MKTNKPASLSENQCKDIYDMRQSTELSWKKIGAMFQTSDKTAARAYAYIESLNQPEPVVETPVVKTHVVEKLEDSFDAIISGQTLCIINRTTNESVFVSSVDAQYVKIVDIIKENILNSDEASRNQAFKKCFELASPKKVIEKLVFGRVTYDPVSDTIKDEYGVTIPDRLISKISELVEKEEMTDASSWMKFTQKLLENPSNRALRELYSFIVAKDIKINEDGDIICYKKVRDTYYDIYSNTMFNGVGETLSIPRNTVDEDSNQTCSYGLHVCSKSYLPSFSSNNGKDRILKVVVNPKDVVAVPSDYSGAKCRVCEYTVLEDVTNQF